MITEESLAAARDRLVAAGVWDAEGDLAALVDRFAHPTEPERAARRLELAIAERCARIPLEHIVGAVAFDGLELVVGSGAFIPREVSTAVVDRALDVELPAGSRVIDLCSGVGAIGLAIAARRPDLTVTCVERDATALAYLKRNIGRQAGRIGDVRVIEADIDDPGWHSDLAPVDLIVANPPYVGPEITLLPEWSAHQPPEALYAAGGGLALLRSVAKLSHTLLRAHGTVVIEHDRAQPDAVRWLLAEYGLRSVETFDDTAGEPRVTRGRQTEPAPTEGQR